jgi:two-component system sensor histidine kinase VicK
METHFFKNLPGKYKNAYRNYYTGQNLLSVRIASTIFFVLNAVIRLFYFIFPLSLTKAENFPEFNITNWVFLSAGAFFYVFSLILIDQYKKIKKSTAIMALFIFVFSLFIICSGMFSSFIATGSPRDSLTLYLIALTMVSLLFVFEYYETIIVIVSAELLFSFLLIYSHADPTEMIYNQLISLILFFGFFLVSRYFYSFKANYYTQVLEIREKNTEIERASDFKGQLLGTVAHDLRNPIAAIESVAMLMEMDEIDAETRENLDLIRTSCNKARSIIEELLESARNENITVFTTEKTELNNLLKNLIENWKVQQNVENLELVSAVYPAYAEINLEKFHRVTDNLIGNALKFSRPGTKVRLFLYKKDGDVIIEVKDEGIGIPAAKLPIIFDPFTKAGRPGLNGEQSTGLGLSIVKQIVEKHNGKIEVESEEGKGSTFRIMLPAGL